MLTDDEKSKIRAEMEYRELVLSELRPPKGLFAKFWNGCSHPIIITVLGGFILSLAATQHQHHLERKEQSLLYKRQEQESKIQLLEEFTKQFERDMTIQHALRIKQILLISDTPDPLGRTREEATKHYVELSTYYYQNCHPQAMLQKARAIFTSENVLIELDKLEPQVTALLEIQPPQTVKLSKEEVTTFLEKIHDLGSKTHSGMYSLAKVMGEEIRNAPNKAVDTTAVSAPR